MDPSVTDWLNTWNWALMFLWMGIALYYMRQVRKRDRLIALQLELLDNLMDFYMAAHQGHVQPEPATEHQEAA